MDNSLDFTRSSVLNNIPKKKLLQAISVVEEENKEDLPTKNVKLIAINRYFESNIPVEYWTLKMDKDFHGDSRLLTKYNEYTNDLKKSYITGESICFAGPLGVGKTMTVANILKKAVHMGFNTLYVNLSDIVVVLTQANNDDKFLARRELTMVDFLVIDEFDPRFMPSNNAADLYARSLESIFRMRSQNKLPTLMCTNSPNVIESFTGSLKESLDSLMKGYLKVFPVFGEDYRKKKGSL